MREISGMEVLVRVVEKGSFSAAAQALSITPSAISKHVSRMEAELGTRLINRSTHELSLTENGRIYYEHCQKIMRDISIAREAMHEASSSLTGTLKLHLTRGTGEQLFASLRHFMQTYPNLTIDLTVATSSVDVVQEGYDLAIRSGTEDQAKSNHSSTEFRPLFDAHYVICASEDYFRRHKRPRRPADLVHHNCLLYVGQPYSDKWYFNNGRRRYSVTVGGHLRTNDWSVVRDASLEGIGIARLLSFQSQSSIADGTLEVLFEKEAVHDRKIWAIYPRAHRVSRKVSVFLDFIVAQKRT